MKRTKTGIHILAALALAACSANAAEPKYNLDQCLQDRAQTTTIAFSGLAVITGNLEAQSFFPPGKVADYWGFQFLRDNDPDNMGHNTSFLTRAACNVLFILDDQQLGRLKVLAANQAGSINMYALRRYTLMQAFRRLVDADLPAGADGLDVEAVKAESRAIYLIDGEMSFDRAAVFADIFRSLSPAQRAYLDAMVGKGWASWPDKDMDDVRQKLAGLAHDQNVAVMTYAGDLYSWYAGSIDADVYFCPERHGTYYGGFYIKDAPAMGREGYTIDEQLTATAGSALCDSSKGYVTPAQAALMTAVVDRQRANLYAGTANIVGCRTGIATALRGLVRATAPTAGELAATRETVLSLSGLYGELDGENNHRYAGAFAELRKSLGASQLAALQALRKAIMSGTYSDGTPFDFSVCATPFLYSAVVADAGLLAPYIAAATDLFHYPTPWGSVSGGWIWTPLGWTYDTLYPFVYVQSGSCWAWVPPFATSDNLYCYLFTNPGGWIYTSQAWAGWFYQFGTDPGWRKW